MYVTVQQPERTCRYGHGPLELDPSLFGLSGIEPSPADDSAVIINNTFYTVRVWRCPVCGTVELVDAGD